MALLAFFTREMRTSRRKGRSRLVGTVAEYTVNSPIIISNLKSSPKRGRNSCKSALLRPWRVRIWLPKAPKFAREMRTSENICALWQNLLKTVQLLFFHSFSFVCLFEGWDTCSVYGSPCFFHKRNENILQKRKKPSTMHCGRIY